MLIFRSSADPVDDRPLRLPWGFFTVQSHGIFKIEVRVNNQ